MEKKLVVSVGAGPGQTLFIEKLKERGFSVASFGRGKNDPRAIELSDFFCEIDTADYQAAIRWLNSLPVKPYAVGSYAGGRSIMTMQKIVEYFDCSGKIPNDFLIGMDKYEQQKVYEQYGISSIKTNLASEVAIDMIEDDKEYIIKPRIGRGSFGVYVEKGTNLKVCIANNAIEEDTIIQELRYGKEYRTLIYIQNAEIKILVPITRDSYGSSFLLGRLSYDTTDLERIRQYFVDFIKRTKIQNSVIKADLICSQDSIDMIEMDIGVGGGVYFKEYISCLLDADLVSLYIDFIIGKDIDEQQVHNNSLIMDYIYNWKNKPISYELSESLRKVKMKVGNCKFQINRLHPEKNGHAETNADFIFTIIHADREIDLQELNTYVNDECFSEVTDERN